MSKTGCVYNIIDNTTLFYYLKIICLIIIILKGSSDAKFIFKLFEQMCVGSVCTHPSNNDEKSTECLF